MKFQSLATKQGHHVEVNDATRLATYHAAILSVENEVEDLTDCINTL